MSWFLQKGFYKETVTGKCIYLWNVSILLSEKAYQIAYPCHPLSKFVFITNLASVCGHIYVPYVNTLLLLSSSLLTKKKKVIIHCKFEIVYNFFGSFCFTGLYHWYLSNLTFFISTWDVLSELVVICCL